MRWVNQWSFSCANRLAAVMNEGHQKRSVYYFAFQVILGGLVKNLVLLFFALLFGVLIPTLIIAAVFSSLRMIAGGYHMDTYGKCLFVSIAMFILAALTAQYTYPYWNSPAPATLIAATFITGLYVLIRYAPKDTPHKPITDPGEIKKFKALSIVYLFLLLAASSVLAAYKLNMYTLSLCFGMLLELFMVTPMGHKFFDRIKFYLKV